MRTLYPPGLRVPVTVPDDHVDLYLAQGWTRADDAVSPEPEDADRDDVRAEVTTTGEPVPPAKRGPGSSVGRWREYADAVGVDVSADATRDDIIAALDVSGVPTE